MLKQETATATAEADRTAGLWAYFQGDFVPLAEAKISVMTHAFNYGTAVFEGVRAYWNAEQEQLYGLDLLAHYRRIHRSIRLLQLELRHTPEELVAITVELLKRDGFREDAYVRPICYKSSEIIGVRLHNLESDLTIFAVPFGKYIDTEAGIRAQVSTWRRTDDNAIPARSKITGSYVNGALNQDGHVSEGSAENLFIVRDGTLITPPASDNILEGITRDHLMNLAGDLGVPVRERSIDRTELYLADEVFLCGTGAQLAPVVEVDRRPVGTGKVGPITHRLHELYFDAVRGRSDAYRDWLTPVY